MRLRCGRTQKLLNHTRKRCWLSFFPQQLHQLFRMDRFSHYFELVSPEPGIVEQVGRIGMAGEEQDSSRSADLTDRNREVDPIHKRHEHVGQQTVWRKSVRNL